jgi:hypothetical protein
MYERLESHTVMTLPKFDSYTVIARFFPALLCAVPVFVLWYFLLREPAWQDLLGFLINLRCIGTLSITVVFLYFYALFVRFAAKQFERRYFTDARGFPTTYFMLYGNQSYSADYKKKFRDRVRALWKLSPLDAVGEQEQPSEARARLDECFAQIRLRVGAGKLVFQHNIWYGFARNLVGGSLFAALISAANIAFGCLLFHAPALVIASGILLLAYLLIFAVRRPILVQHGEAYARQLIAEFMVEKRATPRRKKPTS